ncbi:MAG: hypothetical protein ACRCXC_07150 [Legionella sp.]
MSYLNDTLAKLEEAYYENNTKKCSRIIATFLKEDKSALSHLMGQL